MSEVVHASQGYVEKIARIIVAEEVAKVVANAPSDLDTLKEIADYIASDKTGASQMVSNIDANYNAIRDEVKRATDAEAELDKAIGKKVGVEDLKEYAKKSDIPSLDGYAKNTELTTKRDRTDNIAAADETQFTEWKFHCDVPEIQAALDASPVRLDYDSYNERWIFSNLPEVEGWIEVGNVFHPSGEDISTLIASPLYVKVHGDGTDDEISITVTRKKVTYTKSGEPYVTPTGVKAIVSETDGSAVDAIPKYEFAIGSLKVDEDDNYFVTLEPYHCTVLNGEDLSWPYFKVEAGGKDGKVRDFMLVVDLTSMEDPPTITWPANFHPRTDAETDFACVAGVKNVYWVTEYAPNEFVVAGWQETKGGNAQ